MNTQIRVGAYLLALAVAFVLAFGVGTVVGPMDVDPASNTGDTHEQRH